MSPKLLLDEHFSPAVARVLRGEGFDVIAVAEDPGLLAASDAELYGLAADLGRWIVTANVKDFRPLLSAAVAGGTQAAPLLLASARRFPRGKRHVGGSVAALRQWLEQSEATTLSHEEWL